MLDQQRKVYTKPVLSAFGSIRNLTGGSGTAGRDGMVTNVRNSPPGQG